MLKRWLSKVSVQSKNPRLATLLEFALQVNRSPATTTDADVNALREAGLTDKGIVQLIHVVSDFGSYNRLNLALDTDYDYRDMWHALASQVLNNL